MKYREHIGHDARSCSKKAHVIRLGDRVVEVAIGENAPEGASDLVSGIVAALLEKATQVEHYGSREGESDFGSPEDSWVTRFTVTEDPQSQEKSFVAGHNTAVGLIHLVSTPVDFCMKSGDKWPHW